jgi:hypothetical protein
MKYIIYNPNDRTYIRVHCAGRFETTFQREVATAMDSVHAEKLVQQLSVAWHIVPANLP